MKTDSQIQKDVMEELKWDPSITHEHIGVAVTNGIVTLSGHVPSYVEKWAAEKAAARVSGVSAVVEKIEVKLIGDFVRDDESIAQAVLNQLKWASQVPDQLIKFKVEDGWVYLNGEVEWDFQRSAAETTVGRLIGVKGVTNNLTLKPKPVQPQVIKRNIEEALKREAQKEAGRISVSVDGGRVTLTGDVRSSSEMDDIKWAAWSAPGVTRIDNKMHVTR